MGFRLQAPSLCGPGQLEHLKRASGWLRNANSTVPATYNRRATAGLLKRNWISAPRGRRLQVAGTGHRGTAWPSSVRQGDQRADVQQDGLNQNSEMEWPRKGAKSDFWQENRPRGNFPAPIHRRFGSFGFFAPFRGSTSEFGLNHGRSLPDGVCWWPNRAGRP